MDCISGLAPDNCGIWPLTGSSASFGDNTLTDPNILSFTGSTSVVTGVGIEHQFKLGTLSFTNGIFFLNEMSLNFTLTTHSDEIAYDNHQFSGTAAFYMNLNVDGKPIESADYLTVRDSHGVLLTQLGSMRVFDYDICPDGDPTAPECNTGTVDLIGHINSLDLDKFTNPTGGAFISSSTVSAVPLPSAFWFFGTGLIAAARYRKSR